ncbi:FAD-dependent oxidoreductase [Haloactinomyces albus]|uniref:Succinate dehydrogenase/fumarate reductase flavoprotein subunit n=1 Tax=Haloactinomyces albus TaxID=1352928 RepID=A0AAE3ZHD5_9ACTN|nr:FAD-dependent oxidoreductase [Haloactinomyces albus]MDR7303961.1 succinate dehydrogenase/fumarate reductase flavoprotein subunit [Haloactinomyces albus]
MKDTSGESEYDVVVLGTGAAGLTAALAAADAGASVGLFEKADLVGGTTCLSSGVAWLPANRYASEAGEQDSREEAIAYLSSLSHGMIIPELAEAFVDTVPELIDWLGTSTPLRLSLVEGFPDYHPENPGGRPKGGRSLEPQLYSMHGIGSWSGQLVGQSRRLTVGETPVGGGSGVLNPQVQQQRETDDLEGLGRALIGALLEGCLSHGVTPRPGERAVRLLRAGGRVTGVALDGPNGQHEVRARGGVVLATGGFEWDQEFPREFLRGPVDHPATVPWNTGDGLRMAMREGAMLGAMREAWWAPVCVLPDKQTYGAQAVYLVHRERTAPHSIMVNRKGRRFTNEAANYNAMGGAFHQLDPGSFDYNNQPCWLVFDDNHVRRYGCFGTPPGGPAPDWVVRSGTIRELAETIDIPARVLQQTVQRWNEQVAEGADPDFHRGESLYDGYVGDRSGYPGPASTLGPLNSPPYYAVRLHSSTLGTKGGPRTNSDAVVLDVDGNEMFGLYAAGNVMAAPTGMVYGGAGGTLGPALIFGYRAGRHAARMVGA